MSKNQNLKKFRTHFVILKYGQSLRFCDMWTTSEPQVGDMYLQNKQFWTIVHVIKGNSKDVIAGLITMGHEAVILECFDFRLPLRRSKDGKVIEAGT